MSGRIVLLNGAPRAGKSSIVAALQASPDRGWINLGVDSTMAAMPEHLRPGLGLRPGGERPDLEPLVSQQYGTLFDAIAAQARAGRDVVADVGIHEFYSRPLDILGEAVQRLRGLPVLFVGVRCPIETIMARRNADPRGGYYAAGDTVPPPVQRWQDAVHAGKSYDLALDSSVLTPEQGAAEIERALANPPAPSAFARLAPGA